MPDGATLNVQVANTWLPAEERPNKTLIFISSFPEPRAFLAWLWKTYPGGVTAQLKSEKLIVVPLTADGSEPLSVYCGPSMGGSMCFYTFTLTEDLCMRLLVKNLRRGMPNIVVQEELGSLNIRVEGFTQLRSGRRDHEPDKERSLTHNSLYQ
jgi:hypothetical protein